MKNSAIEWTTHTFNPWEGCTKVSAGCKNCYAEARSKRYGSSTWGPEGTRVVRAEAYWKEPIKWNRDAGWCGNPVCLTPGWKEHIRPGKCACGLDVARPRVFCASLADVFEDWTGPMVAASGAQLWRRYSNGSWTAGDPDRDTVALNMGHVRQRLFALIDDTPNLDWLLVTKRPENINRMTWPVDMGERDEDVAEGDKHNFDPAWSAWRDHVWHLTSVEDQETANARIPELLKVRSAVLGLSMEPLLGTVRFADVPGLNKLPSVHTAEGRAPTGIGWAIVGGESGHGARPCNVDDIRSVVRQCKDAGMPVFVKQLGAQVEARDAIDPIDQFPGSPKFRQGRDEITALVTLGDPKGGKPAEWPEDLRVRELPTPRRFR
jgi:protein gp37